MPQRDGEAAGRPDYAAFESRDDLAAYGDKALLLFFAQLRLGFDDVGTFASNSLTDGSNDKKCDLVAVSTDKQRVVLAQGYMSSKEAAGEAPANKASDLNLDTPISHRVPQPGRQSCQSLFGVVPSPT